MFCKKYEEYMQKQCQRKKLPGVGFKTLKKVLKRCPKDIQSHNNALVYFYNGVATHCVKSSSCCPDSCPVCDGTFFPSLLKEMSDVVSVFKEHAQRLLELHLASGFRKWFIWFKDRLQGNHLALIQEGEDLVTYALINAIAMRKILEKYDEIHYSKQGQVFRSKAHSLNIEILQSPWLFELVALLINLRKTKASTRKASAIFEGCSLIFKEGKLSLSSELFDSVNLEIDLTCPICLDTVFDPVSLTCGHIFCYLCACKAGSVTIVDGIKAASPREKCPVCRGVNLI